MPIVNNINLHIPMDMLEEQLGYTSSDQISVEVRVALEEVRAEAKQWLTPRISHEHYSLCRTDAGVEIGGETLHSQFLANGLAGCTEVVVAVLTVGPEPEMHSGQAFAAGDPFRGTVIDAIGTVAVREMEHFFWHAILRMAGEKGLGVVGPFSPGVQDWALVEQGVVLRLAGGAQIGIRLTEIGMMLPVKSVSAIYGFGPDLPSDSEFNPCKHCDAPDCPYGKERKRVEVTVIQRSGANRGEDQTTRKISAERGQNLLNVLRDAGVSLPTPCGGRGTCGKCKVQITGVTAPERWGKLTSEELQHLTVQEIEAGFRLACALNLETSCTVNVFPYEDRGPILTTGLSPSECAYDGVNGNLPDQRAGYGLAFDLGTTTVVGYLLNLATGEELGVVSALNPQAQYGSDLVSRIHYSETAPAGLQRLHQEIIALLNHMVGELKEMHQFQSEEIQHIVIVGNTVMTHILLNYPCHTLGYAPYMPHFSGAWEGRAVDLGLAVNPVAGVYIPTAIAGYVGADITAGILASHIFTSSHYQLLLDLGTNGEMVLGRSGEIYTCATAAGPAFEGGGIRHGVGGIAGAIARINLRANSIYQTIGEKAPIGICGSGVLDGVAELLKAGVIDASGRMCNDNPRVVETEDGLAFPVAEGIGGQGLETIMLTQKDIRQVQLAKGAIRAGMEVLLHRAGITVDDVERVFLAGGFGNFLSVTSALQIGLFPERWRDRIKPIGNSAGTGAKMLLLHPGLAHVIENFIADVHYVELATNPDFAALFVEHMVFGRIEIGQFEY